MKINSKRRKRRGASAHTVPNGSRLPARVLLIFCAALLIAAGIARGDASALWRKAVFVCLECVGIG
ncbi:MAG: hypothetical protein LBF83_11225 [Spirochaetaceae bacterium]|nr:hypothetical protein [Spirochaetaceae bacterium]